MGSPFVFAFRKTIRRLLRACRAVDGGKLVRVRLRSERAGNGGARLVPLHRPLLERLPYHVVDSERLVDFPCLIDCRVENWMAGREEDAAVLVRQNRSLVRPDFVRRRHNLLLVEPHQRPDEREVRERFGAFHILYRLARDLTETLPRYYAVSADSLREHVRAFHHAEPEHERRHVLRRLLLYLHLHVGERDYVEVRPHPVSGNRLRELLDFLARLVARVGVGVEVARVDAHPAPHHAVSRDGGVEPAGEEQQPLSGDADGKPAPCPVRVGIDEAFLAHLDVYLHVRVVNVHPENSRVERERRTLPHYLVVVERERLVGPPRLRLERARALRLRNLALAGDFLLYRADVLLHDERLRPSRYAEQVVEHPFDCPHRLVRAFHVEPPRPERDLRLDGLEARLRVLEENALERPYVRAFEHELADFSQKCVRHISHLPVFIFSSAHST